MLVTIFAGSEDAAGVRALLEAVAPDQNLSFLILEEGRTQEDTVEARRRMLGRTALTKQVVRSGERIARGAVAFAPRRTLQGVTQDLECTIGGLGTAATAVPDGDSDPAVAKQLSALTRPLGRQGCAIVFPGLAAQLPPRDELRAMLAGHDGMVLVSEANEGVFLRLVTHPSSSGDLEVAVQPAELSHLLLEHAEPLVLESRPQSVSGLYDEVELILPEVVDLLREETTHDFSDYKTPTLIRRTIRRIHLTRAGSGAVYLKRLRSDHAEVGRLHHDLLVSVTAFFRDEEAFRALSEQVLARLATKESSTPARVWIAGCSTGEEAYTIAMLLEELKDSTSALRQVQLFASDVDESALRTARRGRYPASRIVGVSAERLARFFTREGADYQVTQSLRDQVIFSRHDLVVDAPFSKLDLISCRNVLIYFGDQLRERLLSQFHRSLNPGGTLFLGPSESVSRHEQHFRTLNATHRLFVRSDTSLPLARSAARPFQLTRGEERPDSVGESAVAQMREVLLHRFTPPAVVVTDDGSIISVAGEVSPFLAVRDGAFVNNLSHLVHEGVRIGTKAALRESALLGKRATHPGGTLRTDRGLQRMEVIVEPLSPEDRELFLVVFVREPLPIISSAPTDRSVQSSDGAAAPAISELAAHAVVERLEEDLASTRSELHRVTEDADLVNEELKSANEELTSMNEELRAGFDEMEVSKRELQEASAAIAESNGDLENLLVSTGIPTIFLDNDAVVRRVNPSVSEIYNLQTADVGRPLAHFTHLAGQMPPLPLVEAVHAAAQPIDHEVPMRDGRTFLRRVRPYIASDGSKQGMVVTFTDLTERVQLLQALSDTESRLRRVIDSMFAFVALLDTDGTVTEVNEAPLQVAGLSREEVLGRPFWECPWWTHRTETSERLYRAFLAARKGEVVRYDEQIRIANDQRMMIDFQIRPVHEDGTLVGLVPSGVDITHRLIAEQRLAGQYALTRAITDNASTAIVAIDDHGTCSFANPAAGRLLTLPLDQIVDHQFHDLVHPSAPGAPPLCDPGSCPLVSFEASGPRLQDEESVVAVGDGQSIPVLISSNSIDGDAPAESVVLEIRDMTEIRDAMREIGEREEQFRQMADAIPQLTWIADSDGDIFWYNRNFYKYTGATEAEVLGWGWKSYHDPEMLPSVVDRWEQCLTSGTPFDMVFPLRGADGQFRSFLTRINPLKDASGAVRRWFGTGTDISEQREQIETVRRSARALRSLADVMPDLVARFDHEARHVLVNAAVERVFGATAEELLGRTHAELGVRADLAERWESVLRQVFSSGESDTFRYEWDHAGETRIYEAIVVPELDLAGNVEYVVSVARDLTTELRATDELRDANRRKDAFLATLAHELRNPLAPLRNGLEIMRLSYESDERLDAVRRVMERQVGNMARLIDDLLDVSRLRLNKLVLRRTTVDLRDVVEDALTMNAASIREFGHTVERELPSGAVLVRVDRARIEQVISNLVSNAVKYTPRGGRIGVNLTRDANDVRITVTDSGIGIAPEMLEPIFDLFVQLPQAGETTSGLGIGLALVRQLVELHGGTVTADSEPSGSTFTVRLPVAGATPSGGTVELPIEATGQRSLRILVVDDNVDSADSLGALLSLLGHDVRTTYRAMDLLSLARELPPDVIFADIGLPDLSGYELAMTLREESEFADTVLVAITGWGSEEHRRDSSNAGFDYHLTKPADTAALRRILARTARDLR